MKNLFILLMVAATLMACESKQVSPFSSGFEDNAIDLGRLKTYINGHSIGDRTELTELQKQLKLDSSEVILITWVWDCSPKYDDMPMKLRYNKADNLLEVIYKKHHVIEEYDNVDPDCLMQFLESGEKSLSLIVDFCKGANYDFNNREMTS